MRTSIIWSLRSTLSSRAAGKFDSRFQYVPEKISLLPGAIALNPTQQLSAAISSSSNWASPPFTLRHPLCPWALLSAVASSTNNSCLSLVQCQGLKFVWSVYVNKLGIFHVRESAVSSWYLKSLWISSFGISFTFLSAWQHIFSLFSNNILNSLPCRNMTTTWVSRQREYFELTWACQNSFRTCLSILVAPNPLLLLQTIQIQILCDFFHRLHHSFACLEEPSPLQAALAEMEMQILSVPHSSYSNLLLCWHKFQWQHHLGRQDSEALRMVRQSEELDPKTVHSLQFFQMIVTEDIDVHNYQLIALTWSLSHAVY